MIRLEIDMVNNEDAEMENILNKRTVEVMEGPYEMDSIKDFFIDSMNTWLNTNEVSSSEFVIEHENPALIVTMKDGKVFNIGTNYQEARYN